MYLYVRINENTMFRFNYRTNLLLTQTACYDLDDLRRWLLKNAKELCLASKIKTIFRQGVVVSESRNNGMVKREINLQGEYVNTYDWDGIFFNAAKSNLIQNFINETTGNRNRSPEAIAG